MSCRYISCLIDHNTFSHPYVNLGLAGYFLPVFRQRILTILLESVHTCQ